MIDPGSENMQIPKFNLFQAAQALQNKIRQQIFFLLTNRNNLSFNELKQILNIAQPKLAYHLQILINNNIIINFYDKREGIKDHSFYELSAFSKDLLTGVFLKPEKSKTLGEADPHKDVDEPQNISSNFRTIQQVNYKSYGRVSLKRTPKSIQPVKKEKSEYIEPMLGYNIITQTENPKEIKKIALPSFRQYYLSYKHPFKSDHKIQQKE